MEPVLEVQNVINVFSTTVLNGKKKREKGIFIIIIIIIIYFIYSKKRTSLKGLNFKKRKYNNN